MATPPLQPPMAGNQPPMAAPEVPDIPETPAGPAQQKICVVPMGGDSYKIYTEPYEDEANEPGEAGPPAGMEEAGDGDESGLVKGEEMMMKTVLGMVRELNTGETADEQLDEGFGGPPKGAPGKKPY